MVVFGWRFNGTVFMEPSYALLSADPCTFAIDIYRVVKSGKRCPIRRNDSMPVQPLTWPPPVGMM